MGRVLYEYSLDFENILLSLIPLVIGIVFLSNSIMQVRRKVKSKGWNGFVDSFFKFVGFIVGPLCICIFLMTVLGITIEHKAYEEMIKNNDVHVVEGYVEDFHPMPYEGHDTEHFEINGVYFEYSDYFVMNGYNVTASHGGVITHNGQYLRIKYIITEYDGEEKNVILYIAETSKSTLEENMSL